MCKRLLLIVILTGLGTVVQAETDPVNWLIRANEAAKQANFSGTMSLLRDDHTKRTMKIEQGFNGRDTLQRIVSVSGGEDCEILRREGESTVVFPNRRVLIHGYPHLQALIPNFQKGIDQLKKNYRLETHGQEKVAGRDCQLVMAASRDHYRYGCELCLDTATGLPLRVRMVTPMGGRIEQFAFTSLDVLESIQQFSPSSFWLETDTHGFVTIDLPYGSRPALDKWRIKDMPPGFEERFSVIQRLPHNPEPVYHMVLADALSRISVFITRQPVGKQVRSRQFSRKALNGYVTERHGYKVTVIGGVPAKTVRMIGDSLHLKN